MCQGLIVEDSLRHTILVRTPLDEWSAPRRDFSIWQHTTLTTERHPCSSGILNHNASRRAAADPRLRPRSSEVLSVILFTARHYIRLMCKNARPYVIFFFGSFHTVVLLSLISIMTVRHNNAFLLTCYFINYRMSLWLHVSVIVWPSTGQQELSCTCSYCASM